MYHLDQTKNLVQTIIKVNQSRSPMNTIKVTDQQLEYLQDLVLEAYSLDVDEMKDWDIGFEDSFSLSLLDIKPDTIRELLFQDLQDVR